MSCNVQVYSPNTGEYIDSQLWIDINNEVFDEALADNLFAQTRSENFKAWFGDVYNQGEAHSQVVTPDGEPLLVYHSSPNKFDTFDTSKSNELGFHFGTLAAAVDRFSASKMVLFDNEQESEGEIINVPVNDRKLNLSNEGYTIKPFFLNIRNMIEGVDNLDFNPNLLKEEDKILLNYLDEATYSNDFKRLVLAFYQKGSITYDDVNQILSDYSSIRYTGIHGPEALQKALGNPDGYWYKNAKEDEGSISYVVFDPKNIKSLYNNGEFSNDENTLLNLKQQNYYKSIPENVLGALSKSGVINRLNTSIEDRWYFTRVLDNQNENINYNIERFHRFMSMNNLNKDIFKLNNSKSDEAPYLTINNNFDLKDTIEENNEKIHKEKYEALIDFFKRKFGINSNRINYLTKSEFKKRFPEVYKENAQSVYYNGNFYFFTNNLTSDITVEELLHPFIYTVKELNPNLFNNLLDEAQKNYPKLNAKIQALYGDRSKSVRDQELVTQALSRVFNNVYENEEPQSFLDVIKDFIYWLKNIMVDFFNDFFTGKTINIPIDKLPIQLSLEEIAKILNSTDTQFDIIYSNDIMYSLEDAPTFNKVISDILSNKKVEAKVNEMFAKLPDTLKTIKNKLNNAINENERKNLQSIIRNIENLEREDDQNLLAFQLKGIISSVELTNELLKNLNAMSNSDNDDNVKLSYYMSVYKTAKAMNSFKDLIIELKDELTSNLALPNTKDITTFIAMLNKAISAEDEIEHKIQKLIKTPLLNKLVESSEYSYSPKLEELKNKVINLETDINNPSISQKQKDAIYNKLAPLRRELQDLLSKAPTKENLEKILNGVFKDANILSHIFEAKIANGNPLIATLQDIINDIYDSAAKDMLNSKNEAQEMIDKYSKATGFSLRDMNKRYEQIRDLVSIPTEIILDDNNQPVIDDQNRYQFKYINQDTLLSNIDNSYLTQYMELAMVKDFYLDKHRQNIYNNNVDETILNKYKEASKNLQNFIDENSEKEFKQEIYDFKNIMNEVVNEKTLKEITGDLYQEIDDLNIDLEASSDTEARKGILNRIKQLHIELRRLRTPYNADGSKKEGDALKISELLSKYTKLRYEYYESNLTEDANNRYKFDLEELEKKKDEYYAMGKFGEQLYKKNLSEIQQEVISPDYFTALKSISLELDELHNDLLNSAMQNEFISKNIDQNLFKEKKKDIYQQMQDLSKPYRDEDGVIDGITLTTSHPEVGVKIKDLQQFLEDLRYETSKIGQLSIAENQELKTLRDNKERTDAENQRYDDLNSKRKAFNEFNKQNRDLLNQINNLYKQLADLTTSYNTDYYDEKLDELINNTKLDKNIIDQSVTFVNTNDNILLNEIVYVKGGASRDSETWYRKQILGKQITYIPLEDNNNGVSTMIDIVTGYLAKESVKLSQWWKDNHYKAHVYEEKSKSFIQIDLPIYIWKHSSPNNPNFIETKPAKGYYKFNVKSQYLNNKYQTTYRGIPIPKQNKYQNTRFTDISKNTSVFEFLNYFTNKYLDLQNLYELKGNSVKMGYVLPAIVKTSGENSVNLTNKITSFDGTFSEIFSTNTFATDSDTAYLLGGSQSNTKTIPIRFVGKMDTENQTKNIVASILLFEFHSSLYRSLNESLPVLEASQLLASKANTLENKNYTDRLSFPKKIFNLFTKDKTLKNSEETIKITDKSVLSKSVDDILDIFVYGQRMKPQYLNLGQLGIVDLSKVSSGILGFAAKAIFVGNTISAINNSISTRLQLIINSGIKSNLYSLKNLKNAQLKAPKYSKDLLSDFTKLGNKSLIGQVLDNFAFLVENPVREITAKSEFTLLKNKMEFLTSAKQMSEFEVLFIQFLTVADTIPLKVNGKDTKLSNIEDIYELIDGKLKLKDGVNFSKEDEKRFRNKYQSLARKVAGAYRTTEISSIETNWAGKSGMFLRRYFVGMATNRFQGTRFSIQEGETYTGYQREVLRNIFDLFKLYKGNLPKYWNQLSDKEKVSHIKMLSEYGLLLVLSVLFKILGGEDPKKELKKNSWAFNMTLVALLRAKSELQQFIPGYGTDDLIRIGKNPFMVFNTLGNFAKTLALIYPTIVGDENAFYKQDSDLWVPLFGKIHEKGDSKLLATLLKTFGVTGGTFAPHEYIVNYRNAQNR